MEDIAPELLRKIQTDFKSEFSKSKIISGLYTKIRDGTATYAEANDFAIETGKILANAYRNNLSSDIFPDGRMYYNIAQRIINPTMENNYKIISDATDKVQKILNETANIGIKPVTPELNRNRIEGIINRVSNSDLFDDVAWILDEPVINFSQSIVDDSIRANAEFHANAGLRPKVIRELSGGCCKWCRALAGTYTYPDVPKDVYRRHQRCRCTVNYYPRDGKVQNVHTKQLRDEDAYDRILLNKDIAKKETIRKILNLNSNAIISVPPQKIDTDQLSVDVNHIQNERGRIISVEEIKSYINDASFSVNVWDGAYERYYGCNGAAYVDLENKLIRTAFTREQYTKNLAKSLEVLESEGN